MRPLLLTTLLFGALTMARAEITVLDSPEWIFPGQLVRICLQQPAGSGPLAVTAPPTLRLFDQWDQDAVQRYYFRSLGPGDATLRFAGRGGKLELKLQVLAWAEVLQPRKYKELSLPRVWPLEELGYGELKGRRTLYRDEELKALRGGKPSALATTWHELGDEQIFNLIPGPSVPRTCLMSLGFEGLGKGCPVCGMEVYKGRSGFYPWVLDPVKHPWKVGCPACKNWFPSNDFANGDMHSGDFPDDGFGCEPRKPVLDNGGKPWRFPFIAFYHEWQPYMKDFTPGYLQCASAYAATGDKVYAHKAAVALFRFAESMLDMSLNLSHRKMAVRDAILRGPVGAPRVPGLSGSFLYIQPNWDTPRMEDAARAWDLVFDQLEGDEELVKFCQSQGHPEIKSVTDFRRFVDAGVLRVPMQACLDNAVSRNFPMQETTLATLALALGTDRTMAVVDWLLNDRGLRFALTNTFYQDGSAYESEGYNHIAIRDMSRLFASLERLRELHPELYRAPRFVSLLQDPRYRRIYDFPLESSLIGRSSPGCGDTGACAPTTPLPWLQGIPCDSADWEEAYRATQDPRFLQALSGPQGSLLGKVRDPEVRAAAERAGRERGWQVQRQSNFLDGYGFAILRSGTGENQRALWLLYQQYIQHRHPDMLTYGLEAKQRKLLPELGYPVGWNYAGHWEANWGTHYGVKIAGTTSWGFTRGRLTTFAGASPVQVAEAISTLPGDPEKTRSRLLALVDVSDSDCYALSLERVRGGTEQIATFHGPDGEATAEGLALQPYEGTALGPGRRYGDFSGLADKELSCLALMTQPQSALAAGPWSLDYLLRDQRDVHLRLTTLSPTSGEVTIARGQAPGGRSSYDLTFALQRQQGEAPLTRQYLGLLEPYQGERVLTRIEPLPVTVLSTPAGQPAPVFAPLACRVTGVGFTDTIVIQAQPGPTVTAGGLTTDGLFGFHRERQGALPQQALIRGTRLEAAAARLALPCADYRGTITACDWAQSTIDVRWEPATAPAELPPLAGRHVLLSNPAGSAASYEIKSATALPGGCRLTFALDPRLGEGFVKSCSEGAVESSLALIKSCYPYYAGKTLANEDGSVSYRLKDVVGSVKAVLDETRHAKVAAATLREQFGDRDGDGLSRYVIYDYGVGDEVRLGNFAVTR